MKLKLEYCMKYMGGGGIDACNFAIIYLDRGENSMELGGGGHRCGLEPGCMDFSPLNSESLDLPFYNFDH